MEKKTFTSREWQNELAQIPDLEKLNKLKNEFENLDLDNALVENIKEEYFKRFKVLPFSGTLLPKDDLNKLSVFRVRKNIGELDYPLLASVYNYPPSNILNLNGRANIKFRPVFYCALDGETAFWESDPKIDDVIYLSSWSIESSFDIFSTFILPMSVNQDNKLLPLIRKHRELQIEHLNNGSKHKLDELLFINDMVSEWLKNEIKPYPKSSWIAYNYLYAFYGISFLFYPSASTKSKSTCLAIHPNFVDNSMKLERIYIFTLSGNGFIPGSTIFKDGINLKIRDMNQAEKEEIKDILNRAVEIKK